MSRNKETVVIENTTKLRATKEATLFRFADADDREVWVPNSVITEEHDEWIRVHEWFASLKELA